MQGYKKFFVDQFSFLSNNFKNSFAAAGDSNSDRNGPRCKFVPFIFHFWLQRKCQKISIRCVRERLFQNCFKIELLAARQNVNYCLATIFPTNPLLISFSYKIFPKILLQMLKREAEFLNSFEQLRYKIN